ncbi:MAG: VWA domain-containing protein [Lachnospiraceae bacterium]|nr:VWA domain-containing protein [Lachnospiraceae bacterium]
MIFESMWPLACLLAVPVVIVLYLLKPRGKDTRVSSTLLWEKWLRNQQSKTFLEKFVQNILMYVQILILLLMVLALMSPYLRKPGGSREQVVLVFDTSASMQHDAGNGRTRLEEAAAQARDRIASSPGAAFSVVAGDCTGTDLLAVGVTDPALLYVALDQLTCCDGPGDLSEAENLVEALVGGGKEETAAKGDGDSGKNAAQVIVFTDGIGAEGAGGFARFAGAQVQVLGESVSNVANRFLSYVEEEESESEAGGRRIRCASSLTNYSDFEAALELSLYEGERLVEVRPVTLAAGETALCFFDAFAWRGPALRSELSSIRFAGSGEPDSLAGDNTAYAIEARSGEIDAVLIGKGNLYIEKAYQAATGESLPRVQSIESLPTPQDGEKEDAQKQDEETSGEGIAPAEDMPAEDTQEGTKQLEDAPEVWICDAGLETVLPDGVSGLFFEDGRNRSETAQNVLLTVSDCDLTAGLSSFAIGVNETNLYDVPAWGTGFLWAGDQCAGYYGTHDGVKEVVVGFDIRESDFPLKAEFPVFLSQALQFLSDTSLLAEHMYTAGDTVLFHPQADLDVGLLEAPTEKAGLYEVNGGEEGRGELYVVRFAADSQSDGRITAESVVLGEAADTDGGYWVQKPLRSALIVLILLLLVFEWVLYRRQMSGGRRFYLGVRAVGTMLLLLALFGVSISRRSHLNTTVFLVDLSNSNGTNRQAMEEYLDQALNAMPEGNQYGIVTFGKDSMVEQFLTQEDSFSHILSLPDQTATNFESALSKALSMLPAGGAGRVVFLTDGKETRGELERTAPALLSGQTELLAVLFETVQGDDAYVENVELPAYLYQGDAYTMTVTVVSSYETDAQLQILTGTIETASYDVHLRRGTNRFQFRQTVTGEQAENFEVRVAAFGDTCPENDSYHAYAAVDSLPRVLLVHGVNEDSSQYENVLRSANCHFETVSAYNAPDTLADLLEFKSIVLENVFLTDLPQGFLEQIETYVKDYGGGLVCLGGENSYALGGYRDSVLETVLPVEMELRGVDEVPVTAMIMVIDHSGSMSMDAGGGATNLDLAITAAQTAVDQMRSTDYVGVLTFDDTYSWLVKPVQASDKETIKDQIAAVAEGGGTTIRPALKEALAGAAGCAADIRHVVLLTDGQGESNNYREIMSAYNDAEVTLSTVAVGSDSDKRLLKQLADRCGGRYYYSDFASDIPKIFAQEVFLSGDTYLQNGTFRLAVNGGSDITRGLFADGWPALYGYVSATPKSVSQVLIASEKDDPVLTVMQYGLGHTVAWNSDVTNRWTAGYAGEDDYVQLWKRILDYSVGNAAIGEDSADIRTAGGVTSLVYEAAEYGEQTRVEAVYTDPEGNTWTQPLPATAPGRYETKLSTELTGVYHLNIRRTDDGEVTGVLTTAAAVQYADEYKFGIDSAGFERFIERYGVMLDREEDIWQNRVRTGQERYDLTKWLLLLALLWFVVDIAVRRFQFRPQESGAYRRIAEGRRMRKEKKAGGPQYADTRNRAGRDEETSADVSRREDAKAEAGRREDVNAKSGRREGAGAEAGGQENANAKSGRMEGAGADAGGQENANAQAGWNETVSKGAHDTARKRARAERQKSTEPALDTSALLKKKGQRSGNGGH